MKNFRGLLVVLGLLLICPSLALAGEDRGCDGTRLKADVTSLPGSGVTGTVTICIGEDGLRGKLKAENLTIGHGYTVWFFYTEDGKTGGPGRFDSTVAEDEDEIFRGHVGGLQVSSGGTIKLLVFDHPDLTAVPPACSTMTATNVARANNLLTFACAKGVAQALINIP